MIDREIHNGCEYIKQTNHDSLTPAQRHTATSYIPSLPPPPSPTSSTPPHHTPISQQPSAHSADSSISTKPTTEIHHSLDTIGISGDPKDISIGVYNINTLNSDKLQVTI